MPMYFPDLPSIQTMARQMSTHSASTKKTRYTGLVPKTEDELPEARRQLGAYMRNIWKGEISALEIELAASEDNYDDKFKEHIIKRFFK